MDSISIKEGLPNTIESELSALEILTYRPAEARITTKYPVLGS